MRCRIPKDFGPPRLLLAAFLLLIAVGSSGEALRLAVSRDDATPDSDAAPPGRTLAAGGLGGLGGGLLTGGGGPLGAPAPAPGPAPAPAPAPALAPAGVPGPVPAPKAKGKPGKLPALSAPATSPQFGVVSAPPVKHTASGFQSHGTGPKMGGQLPKTPLKVSEAPPPSAGGALPTTSRPKPVAKAAAPVAKAKAKPKTKKTKTRKINAGKAAKAHAEKVEEEKAQHGFRAHHALILVLGVVLGVLYWRHRKEREDGSAPERNALWGNSQNYQPKALLLRHNHADPTTSDKRHDPLTDRAEAAAEIDRLTSSAQRPSAAEAEAARYARSGAAAPAQTARADDAARSAAPGQPAQAGDAAPPAAQSPAGDPAPSEIQHGRSLNVREGAPDWGAIGQAAAAAARIADAAAPEEAAPGADPVLEVSGAKVAPAPALSSFELASPSLSANRKARLAKGDGGPALSPGAPAAEAVSAPPGKPLSDHGFVPTVSLLPEGKIRPEKSLPPAGLRSGPEIPGVVNRRQPAAELPPPLNAHFESLPQERVVWFSPFRVPFVSTGVVAITDQRILSVYERRAFHAFPPGFESQIRRHQCQLDSVSSYATDKVHRPSLLVAGALLLLWYPAGTILAAFTLGVYFAWPRPELAIWSSGTRRRYPLALPDLNEAKGHLEALVKNNSKQDQQVKVPDQQAS